MARPDRPEHSLTPERFDAALFDLDGVLTATAGVHARCWKQMFDEFLRAWAEEQGEPFRPFAIDQEYHRHVDGKPRYDGVRDFLRSRGIALPDGQPDDPPSLRTVCGLGNRKNELVQEVIAAGGVEVFDGSVALVKQLRDRGLKLGVVTSSRNGALVLRTAGLDGYFEVLVDGLRAASEGLPGKPAPDTFLRGAELLGVAPDRTIVFEDALAGVQAGRDGGFGLVVGVDRAGQPEALRGAGAAIVVADLAEFLD